MGSLVPTVIGEGLINVMETSEVLDVGAGNYLPTYEEATGPESAKYCSDITISSLTRDSPLEVTETHTREETEETSSCMTGDCHRNTQHWLLIGASVGFIVIGIAFMIYVRSIAE